MLTCFLMISTVLSMTVAALGQLPSGLFMCLELHTFLFLLLTIFYTAWTGSLKLPQAMLHSERSVKIPNRPNYWGFHFLTPYRIWCFTSILYTASRLAELLDPWLYQFSLLTRHRNRFESHMFFFLDPELRAKLRFPYLDILCNVSFFSSKIVRLFGSLLIFSAITVYDSAVHNFCIHVEQYGKQICAY